MLWRLLISATLLYSATHRDYLRIYIGKSADMRNNELVGALVLMPEAIGTMFSCGFTVFRRMEPDDQVYLQTEVAAALDVCIEMREVEVICQ